MNSADIHPSSYSYDLPEERIAQQPLSDRSASKLLHYDAGKINHQTFSELPDLLHQRSLIVFNNTKVIPARMVFWKETGARIEIFLLEPLAPSGVMDEVMNAKSSCTWGCMIGNAKKWKIDTPLKMELEGVIISATRTDQQEVQFDWEGEITWSELLTQLGKIPLPPYIERSPDANDENRYQTVYSKHEGAVAAPTAGLHFTDNILSDLQSHHTLDYLTLHVSAGTFQPIKTTAAEHPMHREQILITRDNIKNLRNAERVIAVGTTSLRTLESLYWFGVRLGEGHKDFFIPKLSPYEQRSKTITLAESLDNIEMHMDQENLDQLLGYTEIFIFPGYQFKVVKGLITNFHMPGTTLMMLVAAFIGPDWQKVYELALDNEYRFLSYGDSSLLVPKTI